MERPSKPTPNDDRTKGRPGDEDRARQEEMEDARREEMEAPTERGNEDVVRAPVPEPMEPREGAPSRDTKKNRS